MRRERLPLRSIGKQRWLDQHDTASWLAPTHGWVIAHDHKPFHVAWLPQRQLWALIGMVIQARVADPQEMAVVRLPFDRVSRQMVVSVLQRQHILEDIDERAFAGQSLLTIEQEVAEPGIACFRQGACFADRLKGPGAQIRLRLHAFDPPQNSRRGIASIIALLVGHMLLKVVILVPLLMRGQQIFPGVRFLEAPVGHTSLHVEHTFYIILIGFPLFDLFLLDPKLCADLAGRVRDEHTAIVRDQHFGAP